MGKGNDIREQLFGDFIRYLKGRGINPDDFGRDVWQAKAWEYYYQEWVPYHQREQAVREFVDKTPTERLKEIVDKKAEAEVEEAGKRG